jgi:hypothetical protein
MPALESRSAGAGGAGESALMLASWPFFTGYLGRCPERADPAVPARQSE